MRIRFLTCLPVVFALSACDYNYYAAGITSAPVKPSYKSEAARERVKHEELVAVRTFRAPVHGRVPKNEDEVSGATCAAESDEIKFRFMSPAKVMLPIVKGEPSPLHIFCTLDGKSGVLTVEPGKDGAVVVGPSPAGIAAALVSAAIVSATDRWTYGEYLPVVIARGAEPAGE